MMSNLLFVANVYFTVRMGYLVLKEPEHQFTLFRGLVCILNAFPAVMFLIMR